MTSAHFCRSDQYLISNLMRSKEHNFIHSLTVFKNLNFITVLKNLNFPAKRLNKKNAKKRDKNH